MSERQSPPAEIADIINAVENREPSTNVLLAAQEIVAKGFLLVGTVGSQKVHTPRANQKFYDSTLEADLLVDEPDSSTLQVTWSGKLAVLGAVFGDFNRPEDKRFPEYGYGWSTDAYPEDILYVPPPPEDETHISLHSDVRALNRIRRNPMRYTGSVDIIPFLDYDDYFHLNELPGYRYGLILTRKSHRRVARLPVFGSDIFRTDIEARQPERYKRP